MTKKRIYKVLSLDDIPIENLPNDAIINVLISKESIKMNDWTKLQKKSSFSEEFENNYLFKFSHKSFQSIIEK